MAIIPSTGPVTMTDINNEFGKGLNLYAYRGVKWYRPDNSRGVFEGLTGNNPPIDFYEFRGKVAALAITPTGAVAYTNGQYFIFPNYNKITVVLKGGTDGGTGSPGSYRGGYYDGTATAGDAGTAGGTSSFGSYGSAGSGATTTLVFDAETQANTPLKGISVLVTVGAAGVGGRGGILLQSTDGKYNYSGYGYAASGADGLPGSVTIQVA